MEILLWNIIQTQKNNGGIIENIDLKETPTEENNTTRSTNCNKRSRECKNSGTRWHPKRNYQIPGSRESISKSFQKVVSRRQVPQK